MELTVVQVTIIGLVATVLTAAIRLVVAKFNVVLHKGWMSVVAYVASVLLAVAFQWPLELPSYADPSAFVNQLLVLAGTVLGFATLIYNVLLDKVLSYFNLTVERFSSG
jgi:hypothetical protein